MAIAATSHQVAKRTASPEEMQEIWIQYKADQSNKYLRNRLVEQYLPLVKYNGERIWSRLPEGVELDDLISAGVFGLMDAINAFDMSRGVKFETYCVPRIRGAMLDELRTMDWVPRLVRSKASRLNEGLKTLEAKLGRSPNENELATHMSLSVAELEKMITDANAVNLISLNKKWYETDSYKDVREIDILEDKKGEDPTKRIQKSDLMRLVTKGLNRNERLIIILYYYEELTMKEIGATLDLSESRVSQMHSAIVQRLQGQLGMRRPEFGTQSHPLSLGGGQREGSTTEARAMDDTQVDGSPATGTTDDTVHYYLRKLQRHPKYLATKRALRSARQVVPNAWRLSTHRLRQLPGAVIVGVAKAGTTQLYTYLLRHPRCFGGTEKEINYFSLYRDRPLNWYRARFPLAQTVGAVGGICMEASPSYLPSPDALRRMHEVLPQSKVIVILRDPVARAFSQFQHNKQRHREPNTFEYIVREAIANSPPITEHHGPLPPMPESVSKYIWQGYYASQIAALWQIYSREQVLILDAADLFDDTNAMCQRVFDFLGLEQFDVQPDKIYNRGYYREKVEPTTADVLRDHYRAHDQWLVELTGQTFRWMNVADDATSKSAA